MAFTVAVIGRPNVGKSTLYNRLTGTRHALVDPRPGATRDRRVGEAKVGGFAFAVIDTAGLEQAEAKSLEALMMAQTEKAIAEADLVLMVVDGRAGLTAEDSFFAKKIRKSGKPVQLVINKCESKLDTAAIAEFSRLGFGDPVGVSAEHGLGMPNLVEAIMEHAERLSLSLSLEVTPEEEDGPIKIAIIGRPNAGKSTLINQILDEERMVASPIAGTTRDAIAVPFTYEGRSLELIDTAGMRRKSRIEDDLEKQSVGEALHMIRFCHVAILMIDAAQALDKQDLILADRVIEEGRVLIIAINKWDSVENPQAMLKTVHERLEDSFGQIRGIPVIPISALTGYHIPQMLKMALTHYEKWNLKIPTARLNHWLELSTEEHSPPQMKGRQVRLRYATQSAIRPPTFLLFSSSSADIPESYRRYLMHDLRKTFALDGIPIRLFLRKKKNPFVDEIQE